MKTLNKYLLTLTMVLIAMVATAQENAFETMLMKGDVNGLCACFDQNVRLIMPQTNGTFAKVEAQKRVTDFFATQPIKGFEVLHSGVRNDDRYLIGQIKTAKKIYQLNMLIRMVNGESRIEQLILN